MIGWRPAGQRCGATALAADVGDEVSNYLVIVAEPARVDDVRRWLAMNGTRDDELLVRELGGGKQTLFCVSARTDACVRGDRFFRGTAVSPESKAIAFGVDGWLELCQRISDPYGVGGEFVAVDWDDERVSVSRDVFSGVALLHTSGSGVAAASDSLLLLADLREHLGLVNTQNHRVLLARSILSGHAAQQLGPSTQIDEINFVPAGQGLDLLIGRRGVFTVAGRPMAERVLERRVDYAEELRAAVAFIAGGVGGLASVGGHHLSLQLSGGYDSRLVLGGALRSGVSDVMSFETRNKLESHAADFRTATGLAEHFGFRLNTHGSFREREIPLPASPVAVWASTLLGVYDRLAPARAVLRRSSQIGLNGFGAEILKGNWGWQSLAAMTRDFSSEPHVVDALRVEATAGLRAIGADPRWADASELLYVGYRNGLHGSGGHIGMRMTNVSMLQQVRLAAVGHARNDDARFTRLRRDRASFRGSYDAIADMLALMHPGLATLPYDVEHKNMTYDQVARRLARLGGPIDDSELSRVNVFGTPSDVPAGPSSLGLAVARRRGFDIEPTADAILERAALGLKALDAEQTRVAYREVLRNARRNMIKRSQPAVSAGFAPSKLLTTTLFAG